MSVPPASPSSPSQLPILADPALEPNLAYLVAAQSRATPDAAAIVSIAGTTTYAALAARVAEISQALHGRGVSAEQPIGVCMRRSPDMVATLLAIMQVGAAYVPLDPDDPLARNRRILTMSGCALVVGDVSSIAVFRNLLDDQAEGTSPKFIDIERVHSDGRANSPPPRAPGGARLAYVLFTSGSTGEPKGVEIEHHSVINLLRSAREMLEFTAADRYLAASTIGFDISVAELFLPLISGGSLLLRDRSIWLNPRQLASDIRNFGVTVLQIGPSVWSIVLAEAQSFPRVRAVISTGEPVSPALARKIAGMGDVAWNLYGPTETTVWSTGHRMVVDAPVNDHQPAISAPIGRAVAGTTIAVIDESGTPVAAGQRGELCIGGAGVARGYRGQEALTRERFIHLEPSQERMYRTGDLVAWNSRGELEYLGRNDDQLKIRGVRIEPREIEAALLLHPDIAHAAATWFAGASDSRSVMAAIVATPGRTLTLQKIREWLEGRLPSAMIPSRFVFLPALPLAPSGKVDRGAIRRMESPSADGSDHLTTEQSMIGWTQTQSVLASVWRRLLKQTKIELDDHFFSIGGDSLAAVKMIAEVESIFRISLSVETAFSAPTLARLAVKVDRASKGSPEAYESNYLFPLAEAPGSRPVFFSNVDLRLAVRGAWKAPCSLYSISHWAQGSGFIKAETIADLARQHLARIQAIQPAGPYRLAGFSFGGIVALEIARQLKEIGHEIELLFLLDPMMPYRTPARPDGYAGEGQVAPHGETRLGRIGRHFRSLRQKPGQAGAYLWERIVWHGRHNPLKQWLIFKIVNLHGHRPNPISQLIVPKNRWPAFWYSARRMALRYVAQRHQGPTIAIFPDTGARYQVWKELLDAQTEVHFVCADHTKLFEEPYLSQWLKHLEQFLKSPSPAPAIVPAEVSARK